MRTVGLILPVEEKRFLCPVCGKEHRSSESLDKHIVKEHPSYVSKKGGESDAKC